MLTSLPMSRESRRGEKEIKYLDFKETKPFPCNEVFVSFIILNSLTICNIVCINVAGYFWDICTT